MGKEEPFCTIDVPNVETAAYLMALVNPSIGCLYNNDPECFHDDVVTTFQGGMTGLKAASPKILHWHIWDQLGSILLRTGSHYTEDSAPWLKLKVPTEINGNPVTCMKSGVKVGCTQVGIEELKLLVKECEEAEE